MNDQIKFNKLDRIIYVGALIAFVLSIFGLLLPLPGVLSGDKESIYGSIGLLLWILLFLFVIKRKRRKLKYVKEGKSITEVEKKNKSSIEWLP